MYNNVSSSLEAMATLLVPPAHLTGIKYSIRIADLLYGTTEVLTEFKEPFTM